MVKVMAKPKLAKTIAKEGYTITDFAAALGVGKSHIAAVLKGRHGISPKLAKQISGLLDTDYDSIFKLEERGK